MRAIEASDAKDRFPALLDDVEKGETLVIVRNGKPVARIVPDEGETRRRGDAAFETLRAVGKSIAARGGTLDELIAGTHEGHNR